LLKPFIYATFTAKILAKCGFDKQTTIFISDHRIWQNCQKLFPDDFLANFSSNFFLTDPVADDLNLQLLQKVTNKYLYIVALGSGTIQDLCKLVSSQNNKKYIIIASAPSMNGYLSQNASIEINGIKQSLPAQLPVAVVCDLKILATAPQCLVAAGIGDAMCFYNCWFDWLLSNLFFQTKFTNKPFLLLKKAMSQFVDNYQNYQLNDLALLKILTNILLLSGWGMTLANGSYPASQGEHILAHYLTTEYKKEFAYMLHGEIIAFTTITTNLIQQQILHKLQQNSLNTDIKSNTDFFHNTIWQNCQTDYRNKIKTDAIKIDQQKVYKKLVKIYLPTVKLINIFQHFSIKYRPSDLPISPQQYQSAVNNAKYIRNRITCLDFNL
jgi:glycerol-1-phosphate dehydrogenase [NAD(P)+]